MCDNQQVFGQGMEEGRCEDKWWGAGEGEGEWSKETEVRGGGGGVGSLRFEMETETRIGKTLVKGDQVRL